MRQHSLSASTIGQVLGLDITMHDETPVEIQIRHDGQVVWVNVGGVCVLRICCIKELILQDNRKGAKNETEPRQTR